MRKLKKNYHLRIPDFLKILEYLEYLDFSYCLFCLVYYVLLMFMGGEAGDLALVLGDCRSQGTSMWWLCWQYFAIYFI